MGRIQKIENSPFTITKRVLVGLFLSLRIPSTVAKLVYKSALSVLHKHFPNIGKFNVNWELFPAHINKFIGFQIFGIEGNLFC